MWLFIGSIINTKQILLSAALISTFKTNTLLLFWCISTAGLARLSTVLLGLVRPYGAFPLQPAARFKRAVTSAARLWLRFHLARFTLMLRFHYSLGTGVVSIVTQCRPEP